MRSRLGVDSGWTPSNGPVMVRLDRAGFPSCRSSVLYPKVAGLGRGCRTPSSMAGRSRNAAPTSRMPAFTGTRTCSSLSASTEYAPHSGNPPLPEPQ